MKSIQFLFSLGLLPLFGACGQPLGIGAGPVASAPESGSETALAERVGSVEQSNPPSSEIERAVAAEDRSAEDRALDPGRKPAELLAFLGISPGQNVAELTAGGGYTAELLRRVVGSEGKVYGQNTPLILKRFAEGPWTQRLKKPLMSDVVRVDSEMEDPLPNVESLDAVLLILFYHDTVWFGTDRAAMNRAIFRALRPGGIFLVVDHSARPGDGTNVAQSLHRIEQSVVEREVEAAGFVLVAEADFLRNPKDTRDWNASPGQAGERRGSSDRFALRFQKPEDAPSSPDVTGSAGGNPATSQRENALTRCEEPRSPACTKDYRPVCASFDTGVRCVTTPCPATTEKTYANACMACADEKVVGYVDGACPPQ